MTLLEVIAEAGLDDAGGERHDYRAALQGRHGRRGHRAGDAGRRSVGGSGAVSLEELRAGRLANILLQENDTIIVPPAPLVYVSGYVKRRDRSRSVRA